MSVITRLQRHFGRQTLLLPLAAGLVIAGLSAVFFVQPMDKSEEAERLALYWSRYTSMMLESGANLQQLDRQLQQDILAYPGDTAFRLVVQNRDGQIMMDYDNRKMITGKTAYSYRASKPYLYGDSLGGSIIVEMSEPSEEPVWPRIAGLGAAAAMLLGAAMQLRYRMERRRLNALTEQAAQLTRRSELPLQEGQGFHKEPRKADAADGNGSFTILPSGLSQIPEERLLAEKLQEAADLIRQLHSVRRTMVAEVAHELRTPLAVLRSALDNALYENEPLPPERLAGLAEQAGAMSRLINDLQDLTLSESGQLRLEKRWFQPAAAAAAIVELFEPAAEEKGIEIVSELEQDARLFGDENRICQLLLNLLGNALRHARSRIQLDMRVEGAMLELIVKDDGWGLEPEDADNLFQRYYRKRTYADGSLAPRGMGLGLAVVKGIAEAHGGSAAVSSQFDKGAAFTIRLPLFKE